MTTPLLIGLDYGTTNIKAVAYEPDGQTVALASTPSRIHYPRPGWAHYDPAEVWDQAVEVIRAVVARIDVPARIAAVAVASVGEAGIPLDARGEPTYEAVAWFDRRTIPQAEWLRQTAGDDALFATTGLSLQPIFTLCKLLWLKEQAPDAFSRAARWLHLSDYVAWKLSGVMATDRSLASRTLMFDLHRLAWADAILDHAGISRSLLPPVVAAGTPLGAITAEAARATGLPQGTVVAAGGHDHICGALAAGVIEPGRVFDSLGTAEAVVVVLDRPLADPAAGRMGYAQGAHVVDGRWYALGGIHGSGASVEWLHDLLGRETPIADLLDAASEVPPGSLGACFLPHLRMGNAPHPDPKSRGALIGLTTDAGRPVITRAVLEGLAYAAQASLEPLLAFAGIAHLVDVTCIGGGARNDLLLGIKAAVAQARMLALDLDEATALGAAILAGVGAGIYRSPRQALESIRLRPATIDPDPAASAVYAVLFREVFQPLYDALRPVHHRIHDWAAASDHLVLAPVERG